MNEDAYRAAESAWWRKLDAAPTERFVPLASTGTSVRVQELGDGDPVLFIHGGANSGTGFAPLAKRVADAGRRCLLVDRPGNGLSPPAAPQDAAGFARLADRFVADLADTLELDHIDVISTSLGSYIGLRSTAATPERVRRLVAVAAPLGAQGDERWPLMMRLTAVEPLARLMARLPAPSFVIGPMLDQLGLARARREGRLAEEATRWFQSVVNDTDSIRNDMNTLPPFIDPRGGLRDGMELPHDLLGAITTPTLFLWGSDDPFGGEAVARVFSTRVPGSELRLLDGHGHAPWLDDLDAVAGPAIDFLAA